METAGTAPVVETQFLDLPEGRLAFSDYGGSGDLVIMLPGIGDLRGEYRFLAPRLKEAGYRALTVDLRGHGDSSVPWRTYDVPSSAEDIISLIERLDAGPAHLIGTSFAAAPVVWAAVEREDCVRSAVLINGFVREAKTSPFMKVLFWLMMNNPWRVRTWAVYYSTLFPTHKPPDFQEYLSRLKENLSQPGRFQAAAALSYSSRLPSDERLGKVKVATLVIMGSKDPDFPDPAEEGRAIAEKSGGSLEIIDGAGHYPHAEMPDKTAKVLIDFLMSAGRS